LAAASFGVPSCGGCDGDGSGASGTTNAPVATPSSALVVSLQRSSSVASPFELSSAEGAQNRAVGLYDRAVVLYPAGSRARQEDLVAYEKSGALQGAFSFDEATNVAVWTLPLTVGEHLFRLSVAGGQAIDFPAQLVSDADDADDPCRSKPLGVSLSFPRGPVVPAVGSSSLAAVKVVLNDSNFDAEGIFVSHSPSVLSVRDGRMMFEHAGPAQVSGVGCGMLVSFRLDVVSDAGESPGCRAMSFGIADYAAAHPACLKKGAAIAPACTAEKTNLNGALAAFAKCQGACDAARIAADGAANAYRTCARNMSAGTDVCGAAWHDVVERCRTLSTSPCSKSPVMAHCEGVL